MNWHDFFAMGGYAVYVWTSWGLTLVVLLWQFIHPKRANVKIKALLRRQIKREQRDRTQTQQVNSQI